VKNFRALETLKLGLEPLTALIGPNGTGKSSILRAIDLVLGSSWPSLRSFQVPEDFSDQDQSRELSIVLRLASPYQHKDKLGNIHEVHWLRLTCKPYKRNTGRKEKGDLHVDLEPLGSDGEVPSVAHIVERGRQPVFRPLTVGTDMREHCAVLFIDHRRNLSQHQPWSRRSLLNRLLDPVRKELPELEIEDGKTHQAAFQERYQQAVEALRTPKLKEIETLIGETTKRTLGFLGSEPVQNIAVEFGFADPRNPLSSLRLLYREDGMEIPTEMLGLGVQSAIVVAIFEAYRKLGSSIGTVLLEEPEMYLHPQAQRYFYGLLTELVDGGECQVIYSTHSPVFADITRFEGIRLVRREPGSRTQVSAVSKTEDQSFLDERRGRQKMLGFNATRSEIFFARRALLVEGDADQLAASDVAKRLGHDIDAEDLAIVNCGGKSGIPFFARLCRALGIPFVVLFDEDIWPEPDDAEDVARVRRGNEEARDLRGDIESASGGGAGLYSIEPSLEEALGIGRNAADKPYRVALELERRGLDELPEPLRLAVEAFVASGKEGDDPGAGDRDALGSTPGQQDAQKQP
jgi:putative ATP-dependent endonuclease of OLD family